MLRLIPVKRILVGSAYKNFIADLSTDVNAQNYVNVIKDENKKIACIVMQKPPVNSLNPELLQQLTVAIKTLEKTKFRGFILTSSTPDVFCAGLDLNELHKPKEERMRLLWTSLHAMWKTLYLTPLISIAAINGNCPAGGCIFPLSCDHTIMMKGRYTIGVSGALLGILIPKWVSTLYFNTLNFGPAEHALKLGKLFTPEEALELHIVNELADSPSDLIEKSESEMEKWLKIPDAARRLTKKSLRQMYVDDLESYEKELVEENLKFFFRDETQNILEAYVKKLKERKK